MSVLSINFIENVTLVAEEANVAVPAPAEMLNLYLEANGLHKYVGAANEVTSESYYRTVVGVVISSKLGLSPTDDRGISIVHYMYNSEDQSVLGNAFKALLAVSDTTDINRLHLLLTEYKRLGAEILSKIQYPDDMPTAPEKDEWI
jgi:hypothetical protein